MFPNIFPNTVIRSDVYLETPSLFLKKCREISFEYGESRSTRGYCNYVGLLAVISWWEVINDEEDINSRQIYGWC